MTAWRPPSSRKRIPSGERREQLIEIARSVVLSEGLDGASMKKIAAAAGVNHSLLYRHFTSNVELLEVAVLAPLEGLVAEQIAGAELRLARISDPEEQFVELQTSLLRLMLEIVELFGAVLYSEEFAGRDLYRSRIDPVLKGWLEKTLRSLEVTALRPDLPFVTTALLGVAMTIVLDARLRRIDLDIDETGRRLADVLYAGYATD